jgi:hypothetical protein
MAYSSTSAADYADRHAETHSSNNCAKYVRKAIESGGLSLAHTHFDFKQMHPGPQGFYPGSAYRSAQPSYKFIGTTEAQDEEIILSDGLDANVRWWGAFSECRICWKSHS